MLVVLRTEKDLKTLLADYKQRGRSIGFVPTMGALHHGHISLINKCAEDNDVCIVSIFVNPVQFTDPEDFEKYPRTENKDVELLKNSGCNIVFLPAASEVYPDNMAYQLPIDLGILGTTLEGAFRPGHFDGVVAVLNRFFQMVNPDKAYFGKKDYQQLLVVKKLTRDFFPQIKIIACETVREDDGLAMSSRNKLLTEKERELAPVIYQVLKKAKDLLLEKPVSFVSRWAETTLKTYSLITFEYFVIADSETLIPVSDNMSPKRLIMLTAIKIGKVRLIDNLEV